RIDGHVLATRGETLHVNRGVLYNPDAPGGGFATEVLGLWEIDADERLITCVLFDPDQLDAALAELDALYIAGDGARYAEPVRLVTEILRSVTRRDDAYRDLIHPDVVQIDRRLASLGEMRGRDAFIAA